jgi:hypothetical protein
MSSSDGSNTKKYALLAGGALVAAGAAWYFLRSKAEDDTPQVIVSKRATTTAATAAPTASAPRSATSAPAAAEGSTTSSATRPAAQQQPQQQGMSRETTSALVTEYSFSDNRAAVDETKPKAFQPPVPDAQGFIYFESVGVRIQAARGWTIAEETSPMPNVAMLSFSKQEFNDRNATGMPGEVPVVLLSIEDISNECISVDEFREKSKMMAMAQMQMMTNGLFQPNVTEDSKLSTPAGAFTHILLYDLRTPYFALQVMNLTAVIDGLAYILQVMCNGNEFASVRREVMEMAKTADIDRRPAPKDFRSVSNVSVTGAGGRAAIPAAWSVEKKSATNPIFKFQTASTSRAETIEVYNAGSENAIDLTKPNATNKRTVRAIEVTDFGNSLRVAQKGDVIVACKPKHSGAVVTTDDVLAAIADSVSFVDGGKESQRYVSKALKLAFDVEGKGRLIESRVSERILVYAPLGLPTDPSQAQESPMLTVRVGDPSNDPDCRTSYDEWLRRIKEETDGDSVSDLKKDTINGRECVTFINKEMTETGPTTKEERTAKVIIFLTGVRTTMLRWEAPSGAWRKFENRLNGVLSSLTLDE